MNKYIALFGLLVFVSTLSADVKPEDLVQSSVTVLGNGSSGSGVITKNGKNIFVWTAAHVVADNQYLKGAVDPSTGQPKLYEHYVDVMLAVEDFEKGRKVSETRYLAKIIRFSHFDGGHDLALLMLYKENAFPKGIKFTDEVPKIGEQVFHVGSFGGNNVGGERTFSAGVFAASGRLRKAFMTEDLDNPKIYDQITLAAQPGCSGGGVFNKSGVCIGLITEGLGGGIQGTACIVPSRRLIDFAKNTKCDWAINSSTEVPKNLFESPIADVPININRLKK